MKITAAVTEEQGQTFVVLVKDHVIDNPSARQEMLAAAQETFGVRAALLGERRHRTSGPRDIVRWLRNVSIEQLPGREYEVSRAA